MPTGSRMLAPVPTTPVQLRRALRRLRLSQRQLARRLEVDVGTVNRWATGRSPIPESVRLLLEDGRTVAIPRDRIARAHLHEEPETIGAKRGTRERHA